MSKQQELSAILKPFQRVRTSECDMWIVIPINIVEQRLGKSYEDRQISREFVMVRPGTWMPIDFSDTDDGYNIVEVFEPPYHFAYAFDPSQYGSRVWKDNTHAIREEIETLLQRVEELRNQL